MNHEQKPRLIQVSIVARRLARSETTIRRLAKAGSLPYHRIGRDFLFCEQDVEAYLATHRSK